MVPLAHRLRGALGCRIERVAGASAGERALSIGMLGVIKHLHLRASLPRRSEVFGGPPHDATVAATGDLPVNRKLKVRVFILSGEVAALTTQHDGAIFNSPLLWGVGALEAAEGLADILAVKEQHPSVLHFGRRERVRRGRFHLLGGHAREDREAGDGECNEVAHEAKVHW